MEVAGGNSDGGGGDSEDNDGDSGDNDSFAGINRNTYNTVPGQGKKEIY